MPKTASRRALTAAERYARAVEREAEVAAQLAALDERIAKVRESLRTLSMYGGRTVAQPIAAAEKAGDAAVAAILDATSQVAIDEGSEFEDQAREVLAAAEARRTETRQALSDMRQWAAKVEAETETVKAQLAIDEAQRKDLAKLATAFARQVAAVKRIAGVEKVQAAQVEREAIQQRILVAEQELAAAQASLEDHYATVKQIASEHADLADTRDVRRLQEHPSRALLEMVAAQNHLIDVIERWAARGESALAHWQHGYYLPTLLAHPAIDEKVIRDLLTRQPHEDLAAHVRRFEARRAPYNALRDKAADEHARTFAALPPVA
jgi:hypothetical protein